MTDDRAPSHQSAADQIRELLTATGWTQGRLAEELGVTQPTVSRWLSGKQDPNYEQTMRINNLVFRSTGDDKPENISDSIALMGYADGSLRIKIAPNDKFYQAKLKFGMKAANLSGFIISSDTQTPLGAKNWIVLCSPGYTLPLKDGTFYLVTMPDRTMLFRRIYRGSQEGTVHLLAPGLDPILDATVALVMTVVGTIVPDAIQDLQHVDLTEYESA